MMSISIIKSSIIEKFIQKGMGAINLNDDLYNLEEIAYMVKCLNLV